MDSRYWAEVAERIGIHMAEHSFGIAERSIVDTGIRNSHRFRQRRYIGMSRRG